MCQAVTPPAPTARDIKRDLVGRTLSTATEQRRNSFKIESQNDIRTFSIKDSQGTAKSLRYTVTLKLDNDINQFTATVRTRCRLQNYKNRATLKKLDTQ
ncbi:hypothetical protein FACS1894199_12670 [Bacteroidia bacterium]|nr:hypothetical protein FACS1894199_12670 [Bacteroidia bacterium]